MSAFLLPLKFGSLAALPDASPLYPADWFEALLVTWPPHFFGVISAVLLLWVLIGIGFRADLRSKTALCALLWGVLLPLAGWIGFPRAVIYDQALTMEAHLCGIGAFIMAVFLFTAAHEEWKKRILAAVACGTFLTVLCGLYQYFFGFRETLEMVLAKRAESGLGDSGVMMAKLHDTRVFATFVSGNVLAGFLLLFLPVGTVLAVRAGDYFEEKKTARILFGALFLGSGALCFLLTRSRSAFLSVLLAAAAWAFTFEPWKKWRKILLMLTVVALGGGFFAVHQSRRGFHSAAERVAYFQTAARMIAEKPFLGHGWSGFFISHMKYKDTPTDEAARDPHNAVLSFAVHTGIPGATVMLAALIFPLIILWKKRHVCPENEALFWGLAMFSFHAMLDIDLLIPCSMALAGSMVCLAEEPPSPPRRLPAGVWQILSACGILLPAYFSWQLNADTLKFDRRMDVLRTLARPSLDDTTTLMAKSPDEVIAAYQAASSLRPASPFPYEAAADYFLACGDADTAEYFIEEAMKRTNNMLPSHYMRKRQTALLRKDCDLAEKMRQEAQKRFPGNPHYSAVKTKRK